MTNKKFTYQNLFELQKMTDKIGAALPFAQDTKALNERLEIGKIAIPNRIAVQPMEGADAYTDGTPSELTIKRYEKFAKSGAALSWMEAVAFEDAHRANPHQLMLTSKNLDSFKRLVCHAKELSIREYGFEQVIIMQLTHSGRYSRPGGNPRPIIAYNNPLFEKNFPLSPDCVVSDNELKRLEEASGCAAHLAELVGFDGVDIKACHRYLSSELLSAYNREGEYGGSFENRTRFYLNCVKSAKAALSKAFVTTRLNVYDGFEYPYGFGVGNTGLEPDMTEPKMLVEILHKALGISLIDITIGNPYVNPHVNRPADVLSYPFTENPLAGVARMVSCAGEIQKAFPNVAIIGSGLSYLRQFSGLLAAGGVEQGFFKIAGFGRLSFAYPYFARDMLKNNMDASQCCVACGRCTQLMRGGSVAGCVVRDEYYKAKFAEMRKG